MSPLRYTVLLIVFSLSVVGQVGCGDSTSKPSQTNTNSNSFVDNVGRASVAAERLGKNLTTTAAEVRSSNPASLSTSSTNTMEMMFSGRVSEVSPQDIDSYIEEVSAIPDRSRQTIRNIKEAARYVKRTHITIPQNSVQPRSVQRFVRDWNTLYDEASEFLTLQLTVADEGNSKVGEIKRFMTAARNARTSGDYSAYQRQLSSITNVFQKLDTGMNKIRAAAKRANVLYSNMERYANDEEVYDLFTRVAKKYPNSSMAAALSE